MNVALAKLMSRSDFLDWAQFQEGRHEFDGLRPVAVTGGSLGHNQITLAIHRALDRRLAGGPCRPLGPDAGIATIADAIRYPDAVVTRSRFDRSEHLVPAPVIVLEVVSPGSLRIDRVVKLRKYQAVPSIRAYIIRRVRRPGRHGPVPGSRRRNLRGHRPDRRRRSGARPDRRVDPRGRDLRRDRLRGRCGRRPMTTAGGETAPSDQAMAPVAREGRAYTSLIRHYLSIGCNRAAMLIGQEGIVSIANHIGQREVLVRRDTGEEWPHGALPYLPADCGRGPTSPMREVGGPAAVPAGTAGVTTSGATS